MASTELLQHYQAAVDAHRSHDLEAALASYQKVLALNPSIAAVHNNMAAIHLQQGRKEDAQRHWRQAIAVKPDYAEAHFNLAVLLSEQGEEHLDDAKAHCEKAMEYKAGYSSAYHLMGNILASQAQPDAAAHYYAQAERLASGGTAGAAAKPKGGAADAAASDNAYRWDGVEVGHVRTLRLPDGTTWSMETLSLRPLVLRVPDFLSGAECERLVALAAPKLRASLVMGDARAAERTSRSVFLGAAEDGLLAELQRRLSALSQLPLSHIERSEDLQVVHYEAGATFGMHHDSSSFNPRLLTAFYYLNEVEAGGQTAFPAADGAMAPADAMRLADPAHPDAGSGLLVPPQRGGAILFYNHDEDGAVDPAAVHAGCRVLRGEKWGANHFVRVLDRAAARQPTADEDGARGGGDGGGAERREEAGKNAARNRKKREKAKLKQAAAAAADEL